MQIRRNLELGVRSVTHLGWFFPLSGFVSCILAALQFWQHWFSGSTHVLAALTMTAALKLLGVVGVIQADVHGFGASAWSGLHMQPPYLCFYALLTAPLFMGPPPGCWEWLVECGADCAIAPANAQEVARPRNKNSCSTAKCSG